MSVGRIADSVWRPGIHPAVPDIQRRDVRIVPTVAVLQSGPITAALDADGGSYRPGTHQRASADAARAVAINGIVGPKTIMAIEETGRRYLNAAKPAARLHPLGLTLFLLNHSRKSWPRTQAALPLPPPAPRAPAQSATSRGAPGKHPVARHGRVIPPDVIAAAQASQRTWKVPACITIAQWTLESGWRQRMPRGSNNPFGIKAGKGQRFVLARTREEHKDGSSYYIMAPFRVFATMEEAFDQHGKLLATHPAYKQARSHMADPDAYADALTGTYATDHQYGKTLRGQMRTYDLYHYDL